MYESWNPRFFFYALKKSYKLWSFSSGTYFAICDKSNHLFFTFLHYAKHSPYWEIGSELEEGNVCITPDPDTSYWSGNSTVYRYAEGTKIVFPENQNKRITTTEGHHVYQSKKELLEVPVSHWEVAGEAVACHTSNIKNAPSESVVYYGGLPFRQVSYGKYDYKKMVPCGRGGNSFFWHGYCALCGEEFGFNLYASHYAVADLPSITTETVSVLCSCRVCGGMENGAFFSHKCISVSPNQYILTFTNNTQDPYCNGYVQQQTVYYGQNTETGKGSYEGKEVTGALYAPDGYTRKGYTFIGWNTKPDGSGISIPANGSLSVIYANENITDNIEGIAVSKNTDAGTYNAFS